MGSLSRGIYNKGIEQGIEKGIVQGIEKGRAEGIEKGRMEERLNVIRNMKRKGWETEQIMEIIGIPAAERPKYTDLLKQ